MGWLKYQRRIQRRADLYPGNYTRGPELDGQKSHYCPPHSSKPVPQSLGAQTARAPFRRAAGLALLTDERVPGTFNKPGAAEVPRWEKGDSALGGGGPRRGTDVGPRLKAALGGPGIKAAP